jgi:hypothetical protein
VPIGLEGHAKAIRGTLGRGVRSSSAVGDLRVTFSAGGAAADLWAFGEDALAEEVLAFSDLDLLAAWRQAASYYYDSSIPLPVEGRRITLGHVVAFACMHQIEGAIRPLARRRRRPAKALPDHIKNGPGPIDPTRMHELFGDL